MSSSLIGGVPLFRPEVAAARQSDWIGSPLLPGMRGLRFSGIAICLVVIVALGFAAITDYTRTTRAPGVVSPIHGQNRVFAPVGTRVVRLCKEVGQVVEAGECLFVVTKGRTLSDGSGTRIDESKVAALKRRIELLRSERSILKEEQQDIGDQFRTSKNGTAEELAKVVELERVHGPKKKFASEQYTRHEELAQQGFISSEALRQKVADRLDAERASVELGRDKVRLWRTQQEAEFALRSSLRMTRARITEIDRQVEEVSKELLEAQADLGLTIVAPRKSVVSAIFVHEGDYANSKPAMLLAEASDALEINFWVDSTATPYLQKGKSVRASVGAFPSQRYGYLSARVVSWSQADTDNEIFPIDQAGPKRIHNRFLVKAQIETAKSTFSVPLSELRTGMEVDVLIPTETQSVLRWLVDPADRLLKGQKVTTKFNVTESSQTSPPPSLPQP